MFNNIVKEFNEFADWITNTPPKDLACDIGICIIFTINCVAMCVAYDKWNNRSKKSKFPQCFRGYMAYDGGVIMEPDKENEGYFTSVRGSIFKFLRGQGEAKGIGDEDLAELIVSYCRYVDVHYGKDISDVEKNIGKDYRKLLAGELV